VSGADKIVCGTITGDTTSAAALEGVRRANT